jgi:small subunit ribosomal protein S20
MANHKSSIKRIRQTESKKVHNRFQAKTTRTHLKRLRETTDKKEANELLPKVVSMLDKLAKRNVIHKNKASNLKSKLTKKVKSIK